MAPNARTFRFTLIALLAGLAGCDTLFGPDSEPATVAIKADRDTFDMVGDTLPLEAVVRNTDGERISDPDVEWTSRDASVARVGASGVLTAVSNGQAWVVARSGTAVDSASFTVDSPIPCLPVGELAVPDTVNATIAADGCELDSGRYADIWRLEIEESRTITIDLSSSEFNTLLLLLNGAGEVIGADDDGGLNFDSRLLIELDPGVYYPLATPANAGGLVGPYELSTIVGAHPTPCPATDTLMFPDTVTDATTAESCDYEGFHIDVWRLELADSTEVTLELEGDGFGMYAVVTDTLGRFLVSGGEGPASGSWMELELPPGRYDVWAGARQEGVTGSYTLRVKRGPASLYCPTEGTIGVAESVGGRVSADDCYVWYRPSDGWELTVDDTVDLEFAVTGEPIYPALLIADSAGEIISARAGDSAYMRMDTTMMPGLYRMWVQSGLGREGDYHLSVVEPGELGACEPVGAVPLDSTREGALTTTDCALIDGRYTDVWSLQIDTATTTAIDLTSDKFDAYLIVADTTGSTIARDDDDGEGKNAALTLDFDPGFYHLWITSWAAGSIGGYQLTAARAAGALADRASPEVTGPGTEVTRPRAGRPALSRPVRPWPPSPTADTAPGWVQALEAERNTPLPTWLRQPGGDE